MLEFGIYVETKIQVFCDTCSSKKKHYNVELFFTESTKCNIIGCKDCGTLIGTLKLDISKVNITTSGKPEYSPRHFMECDLIYPNGFDGLVVWITGWGIRKI